MAFYRKWGIPQIGLCFVVIQALGFLLVTSNPGFYDLLILDRGSVLAGQVWRLVSFLALPLSSGIIGILFAGFFTYFILNSIEEQWGSWKTTLYVMSSLVLTVFYSLLVDYPIVTVSGFVSSWFLAAATLYPEKEIQIYFLIPVKLKYLGWLSGAFVLYHFLLGSWGARFYLLTVYANYLFFFGPLVLNRWKQWQRRREFKSRF